MLLPVLTYISRKEASKGLYIEGITEEKKVLIVL